MLDADGNGTISAKELSFISGLSEESTLHQAIMKEVDTNGDGQIDVDEFKMIMRKLR